ncbi:hypothetical protein [Escherichia coli]|uniref:hypothetical protein n=1 Tax=Escherichia coli TaxID=562 RepID=UPI000A5BB8C8|nr:hypothetical protein [Escherichia coli]EMB3656041.1 hypothetical protein [Escherichia coli]
MKTFLDKVLIVLKALIALLELKTDMTVGFIFIAKMHTVHARCGVNALSGLHNLAKSIYCTILVGLISVAHQAI